MKIANKPKLLIITAAVLVLAAFFGIKSYIERPTNLGPELEYIGKSDYGCYVFCDSRPGSEYYYATDLTQDELKTYFTEATFVDHPNSLGGSSANYTFKDVYFRTNNSQNEFLIVYYDNRQALIDSFGLRQTNKQNVVSIDKAAILIIQRSL